MRREGGYQATHTLVFAPEGDDDTSMRGTLCEVQVATVAAHLFNELEHDITYKQRGHAATLAEHRLLRSVERACKLADHLVEQLLDERARGKVNVELLSDAAELKLALEREVSRPLSGDFQRLFRILDSIVQPLTPSALTQLGKPADLIASGQQSAERMGVRADDVICYVLGILPEFRQGLSSIVIHWRGPRTALRRAIEVAVGSRPLMEQNTGDDDAAQRT